MRQRARSTSAAYGAFARLWIWATILPATQCWLPTPTFAQSDPTPAPIPADPDAPVPNSAATAIAMGEQGMRFFEQARWPEALERFEAAEAAYHSPVFVLFAARSLRNSGRLLEARSRFRQLSQETLEPNAPQQWVEAQEDAARELAALEQEIPSVVVTAEGASPRAILQLDDHPIVSGERLEVDPGPHRFSVVDGSRSETRVVTLPRSRQVQNITLKLPAILVGTSPAPLAKASSPATRLPPQNPSADRSESQTRILPWTLVGGGAAATISGGVLGVLAFNRASDVRSELSNNPDCSGLTCVPSEREAVEAKIHPVESRGTVSAAFLLGGLAMSAVGVLLLTFEPSEAVALPAGNPTAIELRF